MLTNVCIKMNQKYTEGSELYLDTFFIFHISEIIVIRLKYKDVNNPQLFAFQIEKAFPVDWQVL